MTTNIVPPINAVVPMSISRAIKPIRIPVIGDRHKKSAQKRSGLFLVLRIPMREERDGSELCEVRWLKGEDAKVYPAARAIDLEPDMRHETERQQDGGGGKPHPPRALPELVIDHGSDDAGDHADREPKRLALDKEDGRRGCLSQKRRCCKALRSRARSARPRRARGNKCFCDAWIRQPAWATVAAGCLTGTLSLIPILNFFGSSILLRRSKSS